MGKIRINELARELEVKAKAVIDYLVSIGIEDKRSHSSSVEGELIDQIRAYFQNGPKVAETEPEPAPVPPPAPEPPRPVAVKATEEPKLAPPIIAPKPALHREAVVEMKTAGVLRKPLTPVAATPAESPVSGPPKRILRPPIRSHIPPPPPPPPAAVRPIAEPAAPPAGPTPHVEAHRPAPPGIMERPAAAAAGPGTSPAQRPPARVPGRPAPPLGPAKPGQPIYARRPAAHPGPLGRPGGRPAIPVGEVPPLGEPNRRGTHPVRGRSMPARGERARHPQPRERSLRPMMPVRHVPEPIHVDRDITISEGITVKDLSEKLGVKVRDLIRRLLDLGVLANINHNLDPAVAEKVAQSFGAHTSVVTYEEETMHEVETVALPERVVTRAPVVTVMGHVDHGKTSLLDAIRETNVTAQEAGGITQHIGAYAVEIKNRKIVFLDTPGHEAFTRMRARGSKVTDIVVLVVAADDGVMPQTLEAIDHARAAKVPIIVAINKIDKPGALAERVKKQLGDRGLLAEDWGGDTVTVEVSAKQKTNIALLLEMILLVADIQDLKANPARLASGTVLEARLDKGRGPVSTVLVQNGTMHVGDSLLVGAVFGRVRAMLDDRGRALEEALPSTPVEILGLQTLPQAGDQFQSVSDAIKAKQIAYFREAKQREINLSKSSRVTLEQLHDQMKAGQIKELPIILKTDVQGSAEVLAESLSKIGDERVKIKVIHSGVGAINVSDVLLASASNSIIVGFNVRPEKKASELADQEKVDIRLHSVIYNVTDEMKKAMVGLLAPTHHETIIGKAEVLQTFKVAKVGVIAGTMVSEGRLTRDSQIRLLRDNVVIFTGRVSSLKRFKDDVSEVRNGHECGIGIENYNDIKVGDTIEAFTVEKIAAAALA